MITEPKTAYDYKDGQIRLVTLPDGYKLDPPWTYSDTRLMSLGISRFQIEVNDSMADEEIGQRIRSALWGIERKTLLDIQAFSPTS